MDVKITPEQAITILENMSRAMIMNYPYTEELNQIDSIIACLKDISQYAAIGKAFVAHQNAVPCDFGYNDEDCRTSDCCDTIRRLCELSAEVD